MSVVPTKLQSFVVSNGSTGRAIRAFLSVVSVVFGFGFFAGHASAQTIRPVTWNVIGLDSNNVNVGPNRFPVGVRICAGGSALNAHKARFTWLSTNAYVDFSTGTTADITLNIGTNTCQDIFWEVTVQRNAAAYKTTRQYEIEVLTSANASLSPALKTPANRELYVEYLISQNRNKIVGYSYNGGAQINAGGAGITVGVGQTFDLELRGSTATQGYEQIEKFIELDPTLFRVNKITSTYSANAGTDLNAGTQIYADGCGWQNDRTSLSYHNNLSCSGVGKYGGTVTQKYNITVLAAPAGNTASAGALIYDYSGSSYHYNGDFSSGGITFTFGTAPTPTAADVGITKSVTATGNGNYTFNLTVTNLGPAAATGVVVTDTVPSTCYTIDSNQGGGWAGSLSGNTVTWNVGGMAVGATATLPIKVNRKQGGTGCLNTANVTSTSPDPNSANNSSSAVAAAAVSDLAVSKVVNNGTPKPGDSVTFTVTVTNRGTDTAANVVVTDSVPSGYTVTGVSPSLGSWSAPNWTIASLAANASATLTITATVVGGRPDSDYLNTVTATSDSTDPDPSNNSAAAAVQPTYLSIAKTTATTFAPGDTGKTFTVTVSKTGNASLGTITVTDVAPTGMTITAMAGTGWTCTTLPTCTRTDDISATTGFPIAYPAITVTVSIANPAPASLINFVSVSSSLGGAYAEAIRPIATVAAPDMAISLAGLPTTATNGAAYTGTFTCTNVGSAAASAGTTCAVSGLPTGVSVTGCTISPNATAWVAGNAVAIGAVVTCSVSGTATSGGAFTVNGTTGATGDVVEPNNAATLAVVVGIPDMSINLAGLPNSAAVGFPYLGTFTCTNVGTVTASAGTTCAVSGLPAGVSVTGCTISPSSAAWVAGNSVPVGAVVTCSVSGSPTASGSVTINGSTGATSDSNLANNTASLAITVGAAAQPIPTLSQWAAMLMTLLLGFLAVRRLNRQQ